MNGYDKVEWGASVEEVKTKYPEIEDETTDSERQNNIFTFGKDYEEGIMSYRSFRFYKGELFHVRVWYQDLNITTENLLFEKFKQKYGEPYYSRNNKHIIDEYYYAESIQFKFEVSNNFKILMSRDEMIEKETKIVESHGLGFDYFDMNIAGQQDIDNAEKNINEIGL